jgi:cytochrome bd-type quinol oxidase subunit 2
MKIPHLVSLLCFVLVIACWIAFFQSYHLEMISLLLAPAAGVAGFILSIVAVRSEKQRAFAWTLLTLHVAVILVYGIGAIYMAYF